MKPSFVELDDLLVAVVGEHGCADVWSECQVPESVVPHLDAHPAGDVLGGEFVRELVAAAERGVVSVLCRNPLLAGGALAGAGDGQAGGAEGGVGGVDVVAVLLDVLDPWDRPEEPVGLERGAVGVDVDHREPLVVAEREGAVVPVGRARHRHEGAVADAPAAHSVPLAGGTADVDHAVSHLARRAARRRRPPGR